MQAHFLQLLINGDSKMVEQLVAVFFRCLQLLLDKFVFMGMFIFEAQVFQFRLDREKTQTMCQRGIKIESFTGNLELLGWKHGA